MPDSDLPLPLLLFLSHAGVDTEAARRLKQRLEAAPEAREHGLRVWFDKDDLRAGEPWPQLEDAIRHRSAAFAVYVGSRGVVNWVDAEIQLALGRAVADPSYRFIPILAPQALGPEALPGFVALYQGVADVERRPDQFTKLVAAILDEDRAHLFFGREQEAETLLRLLRREPLVMVTGDSGSGKSSLAHAGLVPRWRGGAEVMGEPSGCSLPSPTRTTPVPALSSPCGATTTTSSAPSPSSTTAWRQTVTPARRNGSVTMQRSPSGEMRPRICRAR